MSKVFSTSVSMVFGMVLLTGCQHVTKEPVVVDKIASVEASQTQTLVNIKDVFDAGAENIPTLTAVGYAVTSTQPGRNDAQKRLMAIRSARMAAMRDLAEQIHGLQVDSSTTVIDLIVQNDTFYVTGRTYRQLIRIQDLMNSAGLLRIQVKGFSAVSVIFA